MPYVPEKTGDVCMLALTPELVDRVPVHWLVLPVSNPSAKMFVDAPSTYVRANRGKLDIASVTMLNMTSSCFFLPLKEANAKKVCFKFAILQK